MNIPSRVYVGIILAMSLLWIVIIALWGTVGRDHFAAISSGHAESWYQDLGGDSVTEIQDQDIFFHNFGSSIENLKRAEIVIVGSSIVAFAINTNIADSELADKFGLRFYNLSFVGIASGEFTKRILLKYDIHPSLLIINADDGGGGGNFFSKGIQRSFSNDVKTIAATEHNRLIGFKEVIRRNLRWRGEELFKVLFGSAAFENPNRVIIPRFFRDAKTGDSDFSAFPNYNKTNPPWFIKRDKDCHTNQDVINTAKEFTRIGRETILTLIPNTHYCKQQAQEVAEALGIELVLPRNLDYSSWDGGGHLDRNGSLKLTNELLVNLAKTETFHRVLQSARGTITGDNAFR
jgi:hypothetical protein